jgi:hypothetical protein
VRGFQWFGKTIAEAERLAFFRGIDSLRDRTLLLLMLRCSQWVSQVSRLPWSGDLRLFSLDTSPRFVGVLRIGRQNQHRDGQLDQKLGQTFSLRRHRQQQKA